MNELLNNSMNGITDAWLQREAIGTDTNTNQSIIYTYYPYAHILSRVSHEPVHNALPLADTPKHDTRLS